MFKKLLSVGGFTLLSRITGFSRDILMAAILGQGFLSDAFIVAFTFPNYFRAVFGEGTINPAFLPRYAALLPKLKALLSTLKAIDALVKGEGFEELKG